MDSNISKTTFLPWWDIEPYNANSTAVYGGGQSQLMHTAPFMERDNSGSSFNSCSSNNTVSTFRSLDSNSSFSSYGNNTSPVTSNTAFSGYTLHQDYSRMESTSASRNRHNSQTTFVEGGGMSNEPLFDIEKNGDPTIDWWNYYTFHVDKDGAYHILRPGYLATENYPAKRFSDKEYDEKGRLVHKCYVHGCKSKPVRRPFDLERHFTTVHGKGRVERYFCDYQKCKHKEAFDRKDHCREHYREYHREDLVKIGRKTLHSGSTTGMWCRPGGGARDV